MTTLLPRLPGPAAAAIVQGFLEVGPNKWTGFASHDLPSSVRFAATGGSRVSNRALDEIRNGILSLARTQGFGATNQKTAHAKFDTALTSWLRDRREFQSGEALRDDVWNFMAAVLAPDIVYWRFGPAEARYLGGIRNAFQRLHVRGQALDRGSEHPDRWGLVEELSEDAMVQITERPSIGADPILASSIAEAWLRASKKLVKGSMEDAMRRVVLRVRVRNETQSLSSIAPRELERYLDKLFEDAGKASINKNTSRSTETKVVVEPPTQKDRQTKAQSSSEKPMPSKWSLWPKKGT
jgi:hypothetical protein